MMSNHLMHAAVELAKAANEAADGFLPGKLAEIVKLHAGLAVGSALIPVPGADVAAATANIWAMYIRINRELDLPFSENVIKSVAAAVATNMGANAGLLLVGSALKWLPGIGTISGMALMGATIFGVTIAAGIVYMKALTLVLQRDDPASVSEADLKDAAATVMKDKAALKDIIKSAKKDYKPPE